MTAVLPNNAYYVSLDGSRRVTQRTRAHIKPISIFPLHIDDVSCGRPPRGASSDAPVAAEPRILQVPVAADHLVNEKTPPLESTDAPPIADEVAVKLERTVAGAPARPSSFSPVARRRRPLRLPASASQPAPRTSITSQLEAPVDFPAPKRRRGRPRKAPAPEPVVEPIAEPVFRSASESAVDSSSRPSPPVRPVSPSTDPAWQPRVELRRVIAPQRGPETRESEASNADGHPAHQPEAARARAVTRSGRVSRPPLFYGLGGDDAY